MSDTPTPETPIQVLQSGQGRFCCELEKIIEARNAEVLKSVKNLRQQRAELERERDEARRDLVASEELHRRRFGSLKAEFEQVMRERDEARKELEEALQRLSLWEGAVMRMKKQLSFAPPFHQGIASQEEA